MKQRILVVEDQFIVSLALAQILENEGFEVIGPAMSVTMARAIAGQVGCDAAVLDVNLHSKKRVQLTGNAMAVFDRFNNCKRSKVPAGAAGIPANAFVVRQDDLYTACRAKGICQSQQTDPAERAKAENKAIKQGLALCVEKSALCTHKIDGEPVYWDPLKVGVLGHQTTNEPSGSEPENGAGSHWLGSGSGPVDGVRSSPSLGSVNSEQLQRGAVRIQYGAGSATTL